MSALDEALAFMKPLVGGVWLSVALVALANAFGTGLPVQAPNPVPGFGQSAGIPFAGGGR